jgi:7-carboxy-7-deazaguanine synthase
MSLDEIVNAIQTHNTPHVTITGGEPLAQKACIPLITTLCEKGFKVGIETSGALDISEIDNRANIVMDLKTPGSGECDRNRIQNLAELSRKDLIKIVICDVADYEWAQLMLVKYQLNKVCEVIFSPSYGQLNPTDLAEWILRDELQVRMQVQLHKILWGEEQGR